MRFNKRTVLIFVEYVHGVRKQCYCGRYDRLLVIYLVLGIARTRFRNRVDMLTKQIGNFFFVGFCAVFAHESYKIRKYNGVGIMPRPALFVITLDYLFNVFYIRLVFRQIKQLGVKCRVPQIVIQPHPLAVICIVINFARAFVVNFSADKRFVPH